MSAGQAFVQVDSYRTPEQKELFESWVLTAEFHDYPQGWIELFAEAGYTGDYVLDDRRVTTRRHRNSNRQCGRT